MKQEKNRMIQWLFIALLSVLFLFPAVQLKATSGTGICIKITNPKAGSIWVKDTTQALAWENIDSQWPEVKIGLYKNNAKTFDIAKSTANDGACKWPIPANLPTAFYTIRITSKDGRVLAKSAEFSIAPGIIKVTSPAAGEAWSCGWGITHDIAWTKEGKVMDKQVSIQLLKGTTVIGTLAAKTANEGRFNWINPNYLDGATNFKIRVSTLDNQVRGESGFFSIVQQTSLTLLTPNGNEVLKPVVNQGIRWTIDPAVLEVKLEFSRDNGGSFATIADHVPNTGYYNWLVPVNFTRNAIVRVSDSNGKPWMNDGLLECSFKFNYSGEGEEPGAVFWFGGSDPQSPGYGFARIEIGLDRVQFGGFSKSIAPLSRAWHELRVRFNFNRDTAEIRLDNQIVFENAALNTTQEHYFKTILTVNAGGNAPIDFKLDDLAINVVQLDSDGNDQMRFNVLKDNFDRYDGKENPLQSCWQWKNMNERRNNVELNVENRDNKSLQLRTETGKQLQINLPFNLLDRVPFDISDKNMVITIQ